MVNGLARARLGRRRHRGRGGHARPADLDADPGSRRLQAHRQAARGRHRDRPRAHRHPDAAQEGRRRQVRRVLRPGPRLHDARRPRHDRQHGAGIWRDLRLLPGRRRDARLSRRPPAATPDRIALVESLRQGAGHVPHARDAGPGVHRHARARPRHRRAVARRAEAPAGPRAARATPSRLRRRRMESEFKKAAELGKRVTRSRARTSTSAMATS